MIRPAEDVALYRADMADWPGRGELRPWQAHRVEWVEANDRCRRDILARLEASGPLTMRELPGHLREALEVDRVDQRPQRREDARLHGAAG